MNQAYIGIDGGGHQTRFLAIDEDENELAQLVLDRGSKPNHYGIDVTVDVLRSGLEQLCAKLNDDNYEIAAIYAGISGCAKPDSIYDPILEQLHEFCSVAELGGDIKTNFRALADSQSGVMLLAGTGSAIANFYPSGRWTVLGSLGHGAKDVVYEIVMQYQAGGWSDSFRLQLQHLCPKQLLESSVRDIIKQQIDTDVLRELNPGTLNSSEWQEYSLLIERVAHRWVYKAFGRINAQMDRYPDEQVEVVMSGGLWALEYLRTAVINGLEANFPRAAISIKYRPDREAVFGAALLATEL